ncbi:aconitase [Pseudomonas linyingensis]|uniref:Aconitate hydratase B n=1 Tax=Pseudomonas linyingensis TaxID=915471 RepID=A0A1H7ARJ3_9PSED|nr:bifunctional aconitate hydratase 2/2-methylisocitrate dehydratase [Pseudomonas linyingensis]SEJ64702.1 aconitase [Pseudomonas linyingensis]
MLASYRQHLEERAQQGLPPLALDAEQTAALVELLKNPPAGEEQVLVDLITDRVPAGVDEAAYVKAGFLSAIAKGEAVSPLLSKTRAVELLGTMQGGYNIATLVELLDDAELANAAAEQLKHTLLMFDAFHDVAERANKGNAAAKAVLASWAEGEWFTARPALAEKISLSVFKVPGETNTDDLSPAPDAWSRPDIPLHALAMLKMARDGIEPEQPGAVGPLQQIEAVKAKGFPVAYVGDVVGTGSSRKSATNSVLWFFGDDIPFVPNKRAGGFCFGNKIAPIFYNTMEDAGALPIEFDVANLNMGDVIDVYPYAGKVCKHDTEEVLASFELKTEVLLDEVRAGGRIPLIIGRGLTEKARAELGLAPSTLFHKPQAPADSGKGFTLAQKMVGRACGVEGIRPGTYCEPKMTTVGSQDTTGPMTRDELKDLACLGFSADLVMQSFCHTAAYPKPVDVKTHHTLPDFMRNRGGVALKPGDGIIHSWLNRMLLPDTVGTGGDSHTRFPIGISFPAGSGLVAFAAATGVMPLDMPESVLVRFKGKMQPGITLRDLVHAIPYYAIQQGLLTVEKKGKQNIFSGRILEIEGLFLLSDASAERSAAGCAIKLPEEAIAEYLRSNITMLRWMIGEGYGDARTLERRAQAMEAWLADPKLLEADKDAEYAAVIEIDLSEVTEPVLCAPNDPDDARLLSTVAGQKIDEVFIGSCMTNIGHFRAAGKLLDKVKGGIPTRLWLAPPTKMDVHQLTEEGYYGIFGRAGARMEMPGCSLCMGNQARVQAGSTVVSTSTRNFPNRLGDSTNVFLASAELAAVASILGKLPSVEEYMGYAKNIDSMAADIYRYLSFDQIAEYRDAAAQASIPVVQA